ncbi:hypothetical protein [Plesiomonas shigelloides]|uniref:hypothetical protein n=1 Tax=Plesiomonas shigelloides TaxID=703 RepID=UPI0012623A1E|nr:hypothetical protein [Plesiomonas shigelloides]KAB7667808.1 hypothetical protein GBN18_08800 [Plesiomonas shigelloides]
MESKEILDALIEISKLLKDNPNAPIEAAKYTVYGMVSVAFITLLGQLITTHRLIKSEMRKALLQVTAEKDSEFSIEWNKTVQKLVSDLLIATECDINPIIDKTKVASCTHQLNLMLNNSNPHHAALNNAVNDLAMTANGWEVKDTIFNLQDRLTRAAKRVIYQPK